ncbi:bifunctional deaminase-reductase domain-containing protein [Phaeosphaeriaceae sp. PMI808]|nr:bifunctional deaminase-reductase domain-containing protein [Phaeosphaeriaceae sp. PMI808]KAH8712050.1 bifunctional deaminase-reductase domain-containing protein [Phaeosphaeriaceae sp. PMI808]
MPRRIRYNVATSLDGFIAPPDESTDWVVEDAGVDFVKLYEEFDTFIMGRKTYDTMFAMGDQNLLRGRPKHSIVVISRHLDPAKHPDVTVMRDGYIEHIKELKGTDGRDIWIMGGGWLATECLDAGLLDTVEAAIMPIVLREGFKLFTRGVESMVFKLALRGSEQLPQSGIIMTRYDVVYEEANQHD